MHIWYAIVHSSSLIAATIEALTDRPGNSARRRKQMQISTDGDIYDCRKSKDEQCEYIISGNRKDKFFTVTCWRGMEHRWSKDFADETKAVNEFNRFD